MYRLVAYKYGADTHYKIHEAVIADGEEYILPGSVEVEACTIDKLVVMLDYLRQVAVEDNPITEEQAFGVSTYYEEEFDEDEVEDVLDFMKRG